MGASRPVYQLFLERCIRIEPVQRHRNEADQGAAAFFATGYYAGGLTRALSCVDLTWLGGHVWLRRPLLDWPASMREGWQAMAESSQALVDEMLNGTIRLEGTSASGLRRPILPAELAWPGMAIDFFSGELIDFSRGEENVLWKDVTVTEAGHQPNYRITQTEVTEITPQTIIGVIVDRVLYREGLPPGIGPGMLRKQCEPHWAAACEANSINLPLPTWPVFKTFIRGRRGRL